MSGQIAVKRIAAVEVDPAASHQHEFNAGHLRVGLGFGRGTFTGPIEVLYYAEDAATEHDVASGDYTLYDAREAHPTRSEYRLYYNAPLITERARPGDLLLLFRDPASTALTAIVAEAGSRVEERLLDLVFSGDVPSLDSFRLVTPPAPSRDAAEELSITLAPSPASHARFGATRHRVYGEALAAGKVPSTAVMATAGRELAEALGGHLDSDDLLTLGLEAETELYFAISDVLGERKLADLVAVGAGFRAVTSYVLALSQAAKSRRGISLQRHFAAILDDERIRYLDQCPTEGGETPDFILPGYAEYHDPSYPGDRLRMVACKSTVKERWRQVLHEARRIDDKYLLTLDPNLTDDTVTSMTSAKLQPFLPLSVVDGYAGRAVRPYLRTVGELVDELRLAQWGRRA